MREARDRVQGGRRNQNGAKQGKVAEGWCTIRGTFQRRLFSRLFSMDRGQGRATKVWSGGVVFSDTRKTGETQALGGYQSFSCALQGKVFENLVLKEVWLRGHLRIDRLVSDG